MLPALRITNSSPGSCWVSSSGTTRLSEQVMNKVPGCWVVARCLNKSVRCGKASFWNFKKPSMSAFMFASSKVMNRGDSVRATGTEFAVLQNVRNAFGVEVGHLHRRRTANIGDRGDVHDPSDVQVHAVLVGNGAVLGLSLGSQAGDQRQCEENFFHGASSR